MAAENKSARKTKIFISYSRKNPLLVLNLNEALDAAGVDAWAGWKGILPSANWMEENKWFHLFFEENYKLACPKLPPGEN
jgi:hypothetical protein